MQKALVKVDERLIACASYRRWPSVEVLCCFEELDVGGRWATGDNSNGEPYCREVKSEDDVKIYRSSPPRA